MKYHVTCQPPSSMRLRYVSTSYSGHSIGLTMRRDSAMEFGNVAALKLAARLRDAWPLDIWTVIEAE